VKISEVVAFVKLLLEKRFPDTPDKQKIDKGADHKLNFACPICGDSQKDPRKTRGYVYMRKGALKFFCHNCNASMGLPWFIKTLDPTLHTEYLKERIEYHEKMVKRVYPPTQSLSS
jgi:predicted RNA-binding Zn-ribbon protein involved in translation (DUF1610 family)